MKEKKEEEEEAEEEGAEEEGVKREKEYKELGGGKGRVVANGHSYCINGTQQSPLPSYLQPISYKDAASLLAYFYTHTLLFPLFFFSLHPELPNVIF